MHLMFSIRRLGCEFLMSDSFSKIYDAPLHYLRIEHMLYVDTSEIMKKCRRGAVVFGAVHPPVCSSESQLVLLTLYLHVN